MPLPRENTPIPERLGPYVLGRRLGGGGMGEVYEASHVMMASRRVAIKLLKPHLADNPQFVQRFLREIAALGGVAAHPNLVRAEFADIAGKVPYLVMEHVEGVDLDHVLKKQGPFSVSDACNVICQAAAGLDAIHRAGLVHRDLKPSNLMLTRDGVVKILDLGLARLQMTEGPHEELTSANCVLGTMDYTAPEQADDPRTVDIRADIYSLGCTIYKLLTGHAPYGEYTTVAQKIRAHAGVAFPGLPAEVPLELQRIVAKMVAKSPADRFAEPAEVSAALQPFCQGSTLKPVTTTGPRPRAELPTLDTPASGAARTAASPAPTADSVPRPVRWSRGRKVAAFVGVIGVIAVLIAIAAAPWRGTTANTLHNFDEAAVGKRYALFDRRPIPLVWYSADGASTTNFDRDRSLFTIYSPKTALFGLGTTERADYTVQATINIPSMHGAGLFVGHRTTDARLQPDEKACYQFVTFFMPEAGKYMLKRGRAFVPKEPNVAFRSESFAVADVPSARTEMVLEVKVSRHAIVAVKLDGVAMDELTASGANEQADAADCRGAFGVLTHGLTSQFKDAALYLPPADN